MASRAQLSPQVFSRAQAFEPNSLLKEHSKGAVAVSHRNVLLVGRSRSWGVLLLKYLEKFGSEFSFASPQAVTLEFVKNGDYILILLDTTVPKQLRWDLSAELAGSEVSLFYTFPVEEGCWWLPALRRGQNCHGAPAFRRNEFPLELKRILHDQIEA
jgi:hypothetical protein